MVLESLKGFSNKTYELICSRNLVGQEQKTLLTCSWQQDSWPYSIKTTVLYDINSEKLPQNQSKKIIKIRTKILFNKNLFNLIQTYSLVRDLKIILIFHPHYHTHSDNTSRPVNLAVVRRLVSYEDENEYDNDNGNEIED